MALKFDHNLNSISTQGGISLSINTSGSIVVAKGTTAQRPGTPEQGMLRYNTDIGQLEVYDASGLWQPIGTSGDADDAIVLALIFGASG